MTGAGGESSRTFDPALLRSARKPTEVQSRVPPKPCHTFELTFWVNPSRERGNTHGFLFPPRFLCIRIPAWSQNLARFILRNPRGLNTQCNSVPKHQESKRPRGGAMLGAAWPHAARVSGGETPNPGCALERCSPGVRTELPPEQGSVAVVGALPVGFGRRGVGGGAAAVPGARPRRPQCKTREVALRKYHRGSRPESNVTKRAPESRFCSK